MTTDTLYDTDFVRWTERQAEALRRAAREGANLPIDWDHLAEEIEDVGKSDVRTVESLTEQIQIHILKIACSTLVGPKAHWEAEVDEFRAQLERVLRNNHALRARFPELANDQFDRSIKRVERLLRRNGEPDEAGERLLQWKHRGISADEVLSDGLYPVPGRFDFRREAE